MNAYFAGKDRSTRRPGQIKLRSLFGFTAAICVFLAWHRQFGHLFEFNRSSHAVMTLGIGMPATMLVAGFWPRIREAVYNFVEPLVVVSLCCNGVWATTDTFMHFSISGGPTDYTLYGREILWGSYLWGCALPLLMIGIVTSLDVTIHDVRSHRYSLLTCVLAILNAVLVNHFAILLFTTSIPEMTTFVSWLRSIGI